MVTPNWAKGDGKALALRDLWWLELSMGMLFLNGKFDGESCTHPQRTNKTDSLHSDLIFQPGLLRKNRI